MYFGIGHLSIAPIRSGASDKSEMVSQLLFGEIVEILEKKGSWIKIRCDWDDYVGWMDKKQVKAITPSEYKNYTTNHAFSLELLQPIMSTEHYIPITLGACLPSFDGMSLQLSGNSYQFSGQAIFPSKGNTNIELLLKIARKYLYAPYLWGGRSPLGIDCSGFTQVVFRMLGINLPRDAYQQVEKGELIDFIEQSQAGDLAFFENKNGRITHVGILLNKDEIIHASGRVRIDKIDHFGIFNIDTKRYSHRLRVVKRFIEVLPSIESDINEIEKVISNQVDLF